MSSRRFICVSFWCFLLLSCSLAAAQTTPSTTRWPFRAPATEAPADTTNLLFNQLNQNVIVGVGQIMEGTLSPDKYIVGPGDGFLITIWGKQPLYFRPVVSPEGKLIIPQIPEVQVAGLTIAEMRNRLTTEIKKYFMEARVEISLVQLRQFQVYVLGDVDRPGPYVARAVDRVSQLVDQAGGLTLQASARGIRIRRHGVPDAHADLMRFAREGSFDQNPYVGDGDVIFVPHRTAAVTIQGAVWEQGSNELQENDTVGILIRLARGLKPEAIRNQLELVRFNEDHLTTTRIYLDVRDTTGAGWNYPLQPDDRVFVRSYPKWDERLQVNVTGEVRYPGIYVIDRDSTTVTDIIDKAGGFTSEVSLSESFVIRADTTVTADPEYERLKFISVKDMTPDEYDYFKMKARERPGVMVVSFQRLFRDRDMSENIVLKGGDRIVVARNKETVMVTGQVATPGAIIYDPKLQVRDYIKQAGGYGWNARPGKTRVIKARTGEWIWAFNVKQLGPGDTIWVPEKPRHDWWNIFLQGLTTAGQVATLLLVVYTVTK